MRTNADEFANGGLVGVRLAEARGPVRVLIPIGGWSQLIDRPTSDLRGREIGNWAQPDVDRVFVDTLRNHLSAGIVAEFPWHINAPEFADTCVDTLIRLIESPGPAKP